MRSLRTTSIVGTALVACTALALVVWMTRSASTHTARAAGDDKATQEKAPPVRVEVARPQTRPLHKQLRMPATLMPWETAELYAKISGYISNVRVDIGSLVKQGAPLIEIDVPEMYDELRQAQAELAARRARVEALTAKVAQAESEVATARAIIEQYQAQRDLRKITLDRKKELVEGNAIPHQDYDEAESYYAVADAEVQSGRAKVAAAQAMKKAVVADRDVAQSEVGVAEAKIAWLKTLMEYATIRAPFDGVITDRLADPGDFVRSAAESATTPLLTIADVGTIRLVLEVPEVDAPFVTDETEVEVNVKALGDGVIHETVARTAKALDAGTRTMRIEVDLDNSEGRLAPGMYARVTVNLETKAQAMMVPSKAVRVRGRETSVLVASGQGSTGGGRVTTARAVPIKLGYDDGIWAEVLEGLSGDEEIIVSAADVLAPGAPVLAVPAESS